MNTEKPRSSFSLKPFRAMAFLFLPLYLAGGGFAQEKENGQPAQNDSADALAKPDEPKTESELAPNQPVVEANAQPTPNRSSEWNRGATTGSPSIVRQAEKPLLGSYYLAFRPNLHVAQDIDLNGIPAGSGEIETETGIGIGFELGRYLDDWEMLLSVGYDRTPLGNLNAWHSLSRGRIGFRLPLHGGRSETLPFGRQIRLAWIGSFGNGQPA